MQDLYILPYHNTPSIILGTLYPTTILHSYTNDQSFHFLENVNTT
jgi:hypothetical protein